MRRLSIVEFLAELLNILVVVLVFSSSDLPPADVVIFKGSIRSAAIFVLTVRADVNGLSSAGAAGGDTTRGSFDCLFTPDVDYFFFFFKNKKLINFFK